MLKFFHTYVKRGTKRKLKNVGADNSGKYIGPYEQYYKSHRVKLEKNVPKTPQQNGVAEMIRCMLSDSKLTKFFWTEAIHTVVNLINISPSTPLNGEFKLEKMLLINT